MAIVLFFNRNIVINSFKKLLNSLGVYTEVIKNVEITSIDYGEPGSWHIDKSAKWTGAGKAQISFDLNTEEKKGSAKNFDIVLVLDTSGSMMGDRLAKVQSDSIELVEYLLSDSKNRVALINFDCDSTIISSFSNDKNKLVQGIKSLGATCLTNYYAGLQNVDTVMSGYTKEENRDVIALFLTDGYPNLDSPNQIGMYELLKDKYPYMQINGIQYEMGTAIKDAIKEVTDFQWAANQLTLNNVLFESTIPTKNYEKFVISDYIDDEYFYVNSVDDILVSMGTVELEEENGTQKVVWNLGNDFSTGLSAQMYINVVLKDEYLGTSKFLPTNKKEEISYKIEDEVQKEVKSNETPVLRNGYEVIYDTNAPAGCHLAAISKESHYVYETVTKKSDSLSCPGYLFKGWELDGNDIKDIKIINDDNFIMPEHDVTIRATWSKQTVEKAMTGMVRERESLYKVLKNEAESGGLAREYTGDHQDSISGIGSEKIYHYYAETSNDGRAIQNKNNVIFADMCWQMIRTTDTGGVKMIYNGEPDSEGKCGTNRGTHVGYANETSMILSSNYYYGTSYTYNSSTKKFSLDGTITLGTWDETTGPTLVGKYTCKSENQYAECDTLYYVESYQNTTSAYVLSLNSSAGYSSFGEVPYNFNKNNMAGYMYNTSDIYSLRGVTLSYGVSYSFANSYTYSDGKYKLTNEVKEVMFNTWDTADEIYETLAQIGNAHYSCLGGVECSTISYVYNIGFHEANKNNNNNYVVVDYINLTGGESVEDALNKMLKADDINMTNSTIKSAVDAWYERYMLSYADYLEDTIYCNNRIIKSLGRFDPNSDVYSGVNLTFGSVGNDLFCPTITDRFSVSNTKARLKYPVGLMTAPEMNLLNNRNAYVSGDGKAYWLATPTTVSHRNTSYEDMLYPAVIYYMTSSGSGGFSNNALRPAISLTAGIGYSDGDGSMDNPYIVDYD